MTRRPDTGFSLIEVIVALALFALIGSAGFTMLDQVLRTQTRTEGRLERLAEMQRAMHLLALDFGRAQSASVQVTPDQSVSVTRDTVEGSLGLSYAFKDGSFYRMVTQPDGATRALQPVLTGVENIDWQFYDSENGWRADWPPGGTASLATSHPNPRAIALTITLAGGDQQLRRVALLPGEVE